MVGLLERLAVLESPSKDPAAQLRVQSILQQEFRRMGFRVRRVRGRSTGGSLLAVPEERKPGEPLQLLLGHCDTVWPVGTLDRMPVVCRGGRLYGPGVFDMKGGLVVMVFALEALRSVGCEPSVSPVVFVNSDEEIGSPESTPHIRRLARASDRVYVLEPALGPSGKLKTARKGGGHFLVRIMGKAAHAGLEPEKGASAILELSHVIQELYALNDPARGITVNVGMIDGGVRPNVVAPESTATVDVRILSMEDGRRVERAIRNLRARTPGTRLMVEGGINRPPLERTPRNRRLWEAACEAASELGLEVEEATAGGGSDGNTASLYAPTLDGLGPVGDGAHADREHVEVDSLVERSALLARLLVEPRLGNSARLHSSA